jgi:ABC-2 type transport system permease protein
MSEISHAVHSAAARRRRVVGVVRRGVYSLLSNPPRLVEMLFWPSFELVVWGFVALYLRANAVPTAISALLGAVLLWQLLARSQGELALSFLEDVWSRNLLNVFVTPLSTVEYITGMVVFGAAKIAATSGLMAVLALVFYGFGIAVIGPALVPFMTLLLVLGWALGVFSIAVVLRFGQSAQTVAWILVFAFQPFSAVFYPVSILPPAAQAVAHVIPASYVFEGMRAVLDGQGVDWAALGTAAGLDALFAAAAVWALAYALRHARRHGKLSRFGE